MSRSYLIEKFSTDVRGYLGKRAGYSTAEEFYVLHNSICLLGAALNQRDAMSAGYYREEADYCFNLLLKNQWLFREKQLIGELQELFGKMTKAPGDEYLRHLL